MICMYKVVCQASDNLHSSTEAKEVKQSQALYSKTNMLKCFPFVQIFSEPKKAAQVEQTLCDYGKFIKVNTCLVGHTLHLSSALVPC